MDDGLEAYGARVMVDRAEVFKEADRLRAQRGKEAVRVSVRRVRERLTRGGSFSDVAPVLADWKASRNYQPVIELMELPIALQRRLGEFGKLVLDEVQANESKIRDQERANLDIERRSYQDLLDEASLTVDALEARVSELTAEVGRLRRSGATEAGAVEGARVGAPKPVEKPSKFGQFVGALHARGLERKATVTEQDDFWQAVEAEALALMRLRGPMYAGDIYVALPRHLSERGMQVEMPLSVGWLRYRLRAAAAAGAGFVERELRFFPVDGAGSDQAAGSETGKKPLRPPVP
ncbi:DNA-binding protein [Methylobacterium thuringiense]|uniref:KfrA N-terminal DNA-binding domain-containing protein n=1 Tax=Methylobacterium thuringiense TaxID=1003091 RepID=A0ABQ4TKU7_9HYPH|nr:DNA-binding protein [Methylobacterium thuringiense]GJE54889.1 hypothetical protein EKPJFOCH_1374 [Methylobacterium thuringiense]